MVGIGPLSLAMNQFIAMVLAGLALSAAAQPDRWVRVGGIADTHHDFLDTDSVKRSGDKVTVWTRRDFVTSPSTLWHEIEFDCSTRTETILAYVRDDGGTVSHNSVRPHRGPSSVKPGSVAEQNLTIACR